MCRHTWAIGGVMRSAHAVPQPGGARHPGLVTARPPAARHLDGLHPLSPLAAAVFIRGLFDRYDRVRAVQMRRPGCAAIRGGCLVALAVSFFRAWRLAPGGVAFCEAGVLVLRPGCLPPLSCPPRQAGAGRTGAGSRRGPGSCGSGPPRRR